MTTDSSIPNEAEIYARVTGSRGATVRHEHRDPETGQIVVDSEVTYGDVSVEPPVPTATEVRLSYWRVKSGAPDFDGAAALLRKHGFSKTAQILDDIAEQAKGLVKP